MSLYYRIYCTSRTVNSRSQYIAWLYQKVISEIFIQCGDVITRSLFNRILPKYTPLRRCMGVVCDLTLIYILLLSTRCWMKYRVILDRVITACPFGRAISIISPTNYTIVSKYIRQFCFQKYIRFIVPTGKFTCLNTWRLGSLLYSNYQISQMRWYKYQSTYLNL